MKQREKKKKKTKKKKTKKKKQKQKKRGGRITIRRDGQLTIQPLRK